MRGAAILAAVVTAAVVFSLGYVGLIRTPDHPAPVAAPQTAAEALTVTGRYDVPGGSLTVYSDRTARFQPDPSAETVGACRTFVGTITITQCVPVRSPEGGHLVTRVQEDGSAGYSDGTTFDPETRWFYENHR